MLPSVKNASGAHTKVPSKREEKKRINIRWNSATFFQVGLAVTLLLCFLVMESGWTLGSGELASPPPEIDWVEPGLFAFQEEQPKVAPKIIPKEKTPRRTIQKTLASNFQVTNNNSESNESKTTDAEVNPNLPAVGNTMPALIREEKPSYFDEVQFVPVFPGCEALENNTERRECMSSKISKFINRRFNRDRFSDLETGKIHRVSVQFTVGKDGTVKDIRTRARLPEMEAEAKRVIGKMPVMEPGRQGSTKVDVIFSVPISFMVE